MPTNHDYLVGTIQYVIIIGVVIAGVVALLRSRRRDDDEQKPDKRDAHSSKREPRA